MFHRDSCLTKMLLFLIVAIFFTACYTVNDRKNLGIVFNESKLNPYYLEGYVDKIRNKGFSTPDSISEIFFNGDSISDEQRIIYFKNAPQEWYLINFNASPCWIESIFNPHLSNSQIYDSTFMSKEQLVRIRNRFINEILKPAEQYGHANHIPDTIIYSNKLK